MRLKGRFDSEEVADKVVRTEDNCTVYAGTFSIKVKGEDEEPAYKNDAEPYEYPQVDSLQNALKYFGGKLTDDAVSFIGEALTGEETGKANLKILEIVNESLKASAKSRAYANKLNEHKPVTAETLDNSKARMVRDFMRQSNVDAETPINALKQFVPTMKEYTLEEFNKNKGRV
jgi:hypothetical protein